MIGVVLLVVGVAAGGWGLVTMLRAPRPASLGAALVAAVGLAVALLGIVRLLLPRFF